MKLVGVLMTAALAAAMLGAGTSTARAENPRSVTVMTQNIYQGTELEDVLAATSTL